VYTYRPAFEHFRADIKVVHFAGSVKPWNNPSYGSSGAAGTSRGHGPVSSDLLSLWWAAYNSALAAVSPVVSAAAEAFNAINGRGGRLQSMNREGSDMTDNLRNDNNTCNNSNNHKDHNGNGDNHKYSFSNIHTSRYAWPEHEFDPKLAGSLRILESAFQGRNVRPSISRSSKRVVGPEVANSLYCGKTPMLSESEIAQEKPRSPSLHSHTSSNVKTSLDNKKQPVLKSSQSSSSSLTSGSDSSKLNERL
jgi:hypothetical protein